MSTKLTQARLKEVLHYDPETGVFTWLEKPARRISVGSIAGTCRFDGHITVKVFHGRYLAHRLAWFYVHGRWPVDQIDHVDGNPGNNGIVNLRECTTAENHQNRGVLKGQEPGHVGTCWHPKLGKWSARIKVRGRTQHLGVFKVREEAHKVYLAAKSELHTFQPTPRMQ